MEPKPNEIETLKDELVVLQFKLDQNPSLVNRRNRHLWISPSKVLEIQIQIKRLKAKLILLGVNPDE